MFGWSWACSRSCGRRGPKKTTAAAGLFAFVWLELASPDPGSLSAVKIWLLAYVVVTLAGALCCGPRWCARADPFEVYSVVASRLSPLRRNRDGRIAVGNPFDHLPSLPVRPGTVAVLAVLLGSTAFDSFSASPLWRGFVDSHTDSAAAATLLRTAGLPAPDVLGALLGPVQIAMAAALVLGVAVRVVGFGLLAQAVVALALVDWAGKVDIFLPGVSGFTGERQLLLGVIGAALLGLGGGGLGLDRRVRTRRAQR